MYSCVTFSLLASGWYIYINASSIYNSETAHLISSSLPATNQTCLSFWYHMYGGDIDTLKVLVGNINQNQTVWSRTGQSGNRWLQGQVTLKSLQQYKVLWL